MRKRQQKSRFDFQTFEERICLTVAAAVGDGGSLFVRGDADGPVQIVATGEQTFDVIDDGNLVGTFENVSKNILVRIDGQSESSGEGHDDSLLIQLNDQDVDNVSVKLGHGDNQFTIEGNQTIDRVIYLGGGGADTVNIDVDTEFMAMALLRAGDDAVNLLADANRVRIRAGLGNDNVRLGEEANANAVSARLGHGDNTFVSNADVERRLFVRTGIGNDNVGLGENARVGGNFNTVLGHGDNHLGIAGNVEGRLNVRTGRGLDTVAINSTADIGDTAGILLGSGDNRFGVNGDLGANLFMRGGSGNDTVVIGVDANISGNVGTLLGAGDNTFSHEGSIDGNLLVLSRNPDDTFTADGFVGGRTHLGPGDQGDRGDDS